MKITAIKSYVGTFRNRSRGLVKVETDEGIHGWGEAYSSGPDQSVKPIADYIFELIRGEDPRRVEYIMLKLFQQFRFPPGAVGLAVISAIDHALWDISGKAMGVPVYMLLGGKVRDRIRIYHSIGGDADHVVSRSLELNEEWSIDAFKTSPYHLDPEADRWGRVCASAARFFERVREKTPENWEYAFDPHARIFEPIRALQLANALKPYDPYFYEEPLRPEHLQAWSRLRSKMQVPLATGESLYTRFEFLELMAAQGADIIQPDVCVCGGLLEMSKIAAIAEAHYVSVAPHNPMGPLATAVNVQFVAATPNFKILEYVLPVDTEWEKVFTDPYLPEGGYLSLRDTPGLGIDVDEEAILECPLVHWERTSPIRPDGSTGYI